ncbi:uncharacterized protein LOC142504350 [Primulina tabacum]|uniref:uncharacterized protein LOC142504350 n=1 Tax=Primulina tabacum TaxID=48773 RepID=UPI003F594C08
MESRQNEEHNRGGHNEITHSSQSPRKKRGKTIMKDVHSLAPGDRLVATFNERGQPYGEMQPTLANFVGTIARNGNVLPLDFSDWRKMPKRCLDDAWERLTASFDILDQHRASVMQMMGVSWRRWKTQVKATSYDPNIPLRELVSIRPIPHDLTPEVWQTLCHYWKSNESTSRINREKGSKKRGIHAQGRTNIASLEYKFFQENDRKPTRIEILHLSRQSKKKGGALVDDEAIRVEDLLNDTVQRHLQDKPEGTQPTEVHEDAFRAFWSGSMSRSRCIA